MRNKNGQSILEASFMLRREIVTGLSICLLVLTFGYRQTAFSQNTAAVSDSSCLCWINAQTGKPYPLRRLVPLGMKTTDFESDPNHFSISPGPTTPNGEFVGNWVRDSNGSWINAKTGKPYPCSRLVPLGMRTTDFENDPNHFSISPGPNTPNGEFVGNWVRVPCPPPTKPVEPGLAATPIPTPSPTNPGTSQIRGRTDVFIGYAHTKAPDESAKNLNGVNGSIFYNITPHIAVGGDLSGYFGSGQIGTTIDTSLHRYTYLFGPQFNFNANDKVNVFVHPLFGGACDRGKTTFGTTSVSSSASAFAIAFGGGVDVRLSKRVAVRPVQFDYIPTHFGGGWQSNYRISAGLVIRFGGKK